MRPVFLTVLYFVGGLGVYTIRYWCVGPFRDAEVEKRERTLLAGLWIRLYFAWLMQPFWWLIRKSGIPPMAITTLSVFLAFGSGVSMAAGYIGLGGALYIYAGLCDFFDGRLARALGRSSVWGGALDSVLDRYSDAAVLMGLAWYFRDSWVLCPVLFALVGASLVPYIRARAEASGLVMTGGMMQRAERILYLGAAATLSPFLEAMIDPSNAHPPYRLAVAGVMMLAVTSQWTAVQRLRDLLRMLAEKHGGEKPVAVPVWQMVKSLVSASVATGVDFKVVSWCVEAVGLSAPMGTALGCAVGACVNYTLNKVWTYQSQGKAVVEMGRYAGVSASSALLNAGGVAVVLLLPSVDYRVAWLLVRVLVFLTWNFPLHRNYVFAERARV